MYSFAYSKGLIGQCDSQDLSVQFDRPTAKVISLYCVLLLLPLPAASCAINCFAVAAYFAFCLFALSATAASFVTAAFFHLLLPFAAASSAYSFLTGLLVSACC